MNALVLLMVVLIILAVFGGVWGYQGGHGYISASPLVVVLLILLVLYLGGYLR
jgi:hypothetical protein